MTQVSSRSSSINNLIAAHHGLLRLLSYLLQTLSADQAFANALNQTLRATVPAKWAVTGSLADFMIVVSSHLQLVSLFTHP